MLLAASGLAPQARSDELVSLIRFLWHELNTPVCAMSLSIQAAVRQSQAQHDDPSIQKRLATAQSQCDRLIALLNRVRSEIEQGEGPPAVQRLDLGEVVERTASGLRDQLEAQAVFLTIDCEHVEGDWDPLAVAEIVENLLSNAARHASGSPVTIRVGRTPAQAWIAVEDEGPGIPQECRPLLFERGVRGKNSGGLGLGLSVVRHLAEAHGGRVTAENTPGGGTTFTVYLPMEPPVLRLTEAL